MLGLTMYNKILITGGAGYLGSVITELFLQKGYEVTVLDNLMYNQTSSIVFSHYPTFNFVGGDVIFVSDFPKGVLAASLIRSIPA